MDYIYMYMLCYLNVCASVCMCLCVCLLSYISPLERLFVLKILSHTQQAMKVKEFVGFSLKPIGCRNPALPPLKGICTVSHFPAESMHVHYSIYHVVSGSVSRVSSFSKVCLQ